MSLVASIIAIRGRMFFFNVFKSINYNNLSAYVQIYSMY